MTDLEYVLDAVGKAHVDVAEEFGWSSDIAEAFWKLQQSLEDAFRARTARANAPET